MLAGIDLGAKHQRLEYEGMSPSAVSNRIGQIEVKVRDRIRMELVTVGIVSCTLDHWTCSVNKIKYLAMNIIYAEKK